MHRWLAAPSVRVLHPGREHATVLAGLPDAAGTGAGLVDDAHLAALANRAEIVSFDTDVARFPGVRWAPPPD